MWYYSLKERARSARAFHAFKRVLLSFSNCQFGTLCYRLHGRLKVSQTVHYPTKSLIFTLNLYLGQLRIG